MVHFNHNIYLVSTNKGHKEGPRMFQLIILNNLADFCSVNKTFCESIHFEPLIDSKYPKNQTQNKVFN